MTRISLGPCITQVVSPGVEDFPEVATSYISMVNEKREGKRARRLLTPPVWEEGMDMTTETYVYLWSVGFRILNDMHADKVLWTKPTLENMTAVLLAHALTFTDTLMDSPDYSRKAKRLRPSDPARLARDAASKVAREWDWDYVGKRQRAGRVTAARRIYVPTYTLKDLESVMHIKSKQGQAEALGCGTATIARLRREWNKQQAEIMKQREEEAVLAQADALLAGVLAEATPPVSTVQPLGIVEQELKKIRAEGHTAFVADSAWLDDILAA